MKLSGKIFLSVCMLLFAVAACQKGSGSGSEASLVVETLPVADGHVETPAPGPTFPLVVTIKSTMPPGGVTIDVTAKPDGGTVNFFTISTTTSSPVSNFSITGSTAGVIALVNITVTSVSTPTNKWTGSYKFSRK